MVERLITKRSRKAYIPTYFGFIILISLAIYLQSEDINYSSEVLFSSLAITGVGLGVSEIHRARHTYHVDSNFVTHIEGLISKKMKKITLINVSDIDLKQNIWQRMLKYGSVKVHIFDGNNHITAHHISNPHKFIDYLEKRIEAVQLMGE